ncbi:Fe-S cluster assembly protein SufD [Marinobacterium zhoushanense]|uniref:Fe-S cluster assembly protein SufD n=1 Tax=Marinobacterium zhoushanense TaxID=1679163 RepID=A0ABQ1KSJ0_9GAMM|nr:Fe-S cluster assembly protein SufD [Marinobacterium zhoushanense]GGC05917.1 Fe-S cluster assembly protein SufD [Marinobacterium zhoushanense]
MTTASRLFDTPSWKRLPGADWCWLLSHRERAFDRFRKGGVPDRGWEAWRYTDLGDLAQRRFDFDTSLEGGLSESWTPDPGWPEGHRILFRNGRWDTAGSKLLPLPPGARLISLQHAVQGQLPLLKRYLGQIASLEGHPFAALNSARFDDGLLLYLPEGCVLEQPIYCRFEMERYAEQEPPAAFPRLLVLMEAGSQAQLLEQHRGDGSVKALTDLLVEISLGNDARLFHGRLFGAELTDQRVSGVHVNQQRGSRYQSYSLMMGGALVRNDIQVSLNGEGAEALLDGLYLLDGMQHLDNHLRVDHLQPGGRSDQFYKGILDGHSRAVFNGLAVVHPDAQRSDARQINRNLLLSTGSEIDTKPELQIEADDVKCSHGATVGYLDREQLFYLRSRGIDPDNAQALLTLAFAREGLQRLPAGELADAYGRAITQALTARLEGQPQPAVGAGEVSDE